MMIMTQTASSFTLTLDFITGNIIRKIYDKKPEPVVANDNWNREEQYI